MMKREFDEEGGIQMELKFDSGKEMLEALQCADLYSPELELYVFIYNEACD